MQKKYVKSLKNLNQITKQYIKKFINIKNKF